MSINYFKINRLVQHEDNCINILAGNKWRESDKESFFGPLSGDEKWVIYPEFILSLGIILRDCGIMPSISQARKNGLDKNVPIGFSLFKIGKKNSKVISIFQPFLSPIEQIISEGLYVP